MSIQLKIEYQGTLRRLTCDDSFVNLKSSIASMTGATKFTIQYRGVENDLILVDSDVEWKQIVSTDPLQQQQVTRLIVTLVDAASTKDDEPQFKVETKLAFQDAAELLRDPQVVQHIQTSVFASPVMIEAVTKAAQIYLDSKGDFANCELCHGASAADASCGAGNAARVPSLATSV
jgi:mono/diheme cytochrome c family protein